MERLDSQVNFTLRSRRKGSAGQALIEYILMVTVTVIIIATLLQKLYKPMDAFVQNIMGTYVQCLLETGQLPALGAVTENSGDEATCKIDLFAQNDGSSGDKNKDKDKNGDDDDADKVPNTKNKKSGGGGYAGRSNPRGFSLDHPKLHGSRSAEVGQHAIDAAGGGPKLVSSEYFGGGGGYAGGLGRRGRYVAITGSIAEEVVKKKKAEEKGKITAVPPEGRNIGGKQRKIAMISPEQKSKRYEDAAPPSFDISDMVKIILIAGIILVLVLLIGGQAVSISKNWEKGE